MSTEPLRPQIRVTAPHLDADTQKRLEELVGDMLLRKMEEHFTAEHQRMLYGDGSSPPPVGILNA